MEAGKHIALSLGQEPGEFRLSVDGMSITIHLNNSGRDKAAGEAAGDPAHQFPAPAAAVLPRGPGGDGDIAQMANELSYYRQVSREIYEGLGKLAKDINLSIQDLSLAEIIQTAMGSPGERLDQARSQVNDVLMMTEQATLNIMGLVEEIRGDCQAVQAKLQSLKEREPGETLSEPASDDTEKELWDQVLFQAKQLDQIWATRESMEAPPSDGVAVFSLTDILQILLEFCTNEKVKQHLKAVQAKQEAIFRTTEAERALSLLAAGATQEDGFYQLPVEPLLNLLQSHCEDDRVKDLFAKMAASAGKLFPVAALPLEAQGMEQELTESAGQINSEAAALWEKLQHNLNLLAEHQQSRKGMASGGQGPGGAEIQGALEIVERISKSLSRIIEALSFQDLSGQRLLKILNIIRQLQVQVLTLLVAVGHKLEMKPDLLKPGQESDLARKELDRLLHSVSQMPSPESAASPEEPLDQNAINDLLTSMGF